MDSRLWSELASPAGFFFLKQNCVVLNGGLNEIKKLRFLRFVLCFRSVLWSVAAID